MSDFLDHDGQDSGGLRERKKRAASNAMQLAALTLVRDRGLANVTVEDIAHAADVSPRTFFNYFDSKELALVGTDWDHAEWFAEALRSRPDDEPLMDAIQHVFRRAADAIADDADLHMLRMEVVRQNPELFRSMIGSFGQFERSMVTAISERTGIPPETHIFPTLVASIIGAIMRSAMRSWTRSRTTTSLADLFDEGFAIVATGLEIPAIPDQKESRS